MGQVWLAEQTAPFQRLVAIKLVRNGVSDDVLLDRFESERRTLARMSHPAIAKVYDAGDISRGFRILPAQAESSWLAERQSARILDSVD
jgi:serine/threonine protein kinase